MATRSPPAKMALVDALGQTPQKKEEGIKSLAGVLLRFWNTEQDANENFAYVQMNRANGGKGLPAW